MRFKTKVDWWLQLIFAGFIIATILAIAGVFAGGTGSFIIAIVFAPVSILIILPIWLNTSYLMDESSLQVQCGFIKHAKIDYGLILSVSEALNPISSPALSFDRLEIQYRNKYSVAVRTIIISPKDKQGFIKHLLIMNDSIIINSKAKPTSKMTKLLMTFIGAVCAAIVIGIGILLIFCEKEPVVIIHSNSIQIEAVYGTDIDFSNIEGISLLDHSMREIGAGTRKNGYNGGAWKGHFSSGLLFVKPESSPTIQIKQYNGSTIYISFEKSEQTAMLYRELSAFMFR